MDFRRHQVASTDPEMFIHGPNIAGASAALTLFNTSMAKPDAMPPFCMPTSKLTVRHEISSNFAALAPQYPTIYPIKL